MTRREQRPADFVLFADRSCTGVAPATCPGKVNGSSTVTDVDAELMMAWRNDVG